MQVHWGCAKPEGDRCLDMVLNKLRSCSRSRNLILSKPSQLAWAWAWVACVSCWIIYCKIESWPKDADALWWYAKPEGDRCLDMVWNKLPWAWAWVARVSCSIRQRFLVGQIKLAWAWALLLNQVAVTESLPHMYVCVYVCMQGD
jgi:hypothetical protein